MHKDADIITHLQQRLGLESAQLSIERILRVPQAWDALREPEFLRKALDASGGQTLFPQLLASLALDFPTDSETSSLDEIGSDGQTISELQSTSKQAIELCRMEQQSGPAALVEFLEGASSEWQSAFICAWSEFEDHSAILECVASGHQAELGKVVASALLANMSAQQAAEELLATDPDLAFQFLPWIRQEPVLHKTMKEELGELADLFQYNESSSANHVSIDALIMSALGRVEDAHSAIRKAWDLSTNQSAIVADRMAEIARADQDLVLEAEARQQALEAYPSSQRRGAAALSLLQIERYEDALNLVREGESFEESVAAGLIYLDIQDMHNAGSKLNRAAQQCTETVPTDGELHLRLAEGLESIYYHVQAIRVYQHLIAYYPAQPKYRSKVASLLNMIGDHQNAIQHAQIAVALNPADNVSRELLAKSFELLDEPQAALKHWELLAEEDPHKNIEYGQCALAVGSPEIAEIAANRLLAEDPDHVGGMVLIGQALAQSGKYPEAKSILKGVIDRSPENAEAWVALAESMQATDEIEQAGQTLQDALRANPEHPQLHMARADWLKSMQRFSEALDHTRSALSMNPDNTAWKIQHSDLLAVLGQHDEACEILEKIVASEPANWNAKEKLAHVYESVGEVEKSVALIKSAPEELNAESGYYVGKILAETGFTIDDYRESSQRLKQAKEAGISEPSLDYWMGVAQQKQGNHQPAAKHFLRYLEAVKDASKDHYLDAVVGFASSALELGETTLALTQLEKAKHSFPASISLLSVLSEAQFKAGDPNTSFNIAREAIELYPDSEQALEIFKTAAERAGKLDDAIHAQRQITSKSPNDPRSWLAMARIEDRRSERSASRASLAKAIALGRGDARILADAADCALRLDASSLEIKLRKRAALLDGENDEYFEDLAMAASRVGDLETSVDAWLECAKRNPKDPATLVSAAKSLWKLNRRTAAIGLLQQSSTVAPDDAAAHFELGKALVAMNEFDRGLNEIANAVSLDTENSTLRSNSASILAKFKNADEGLSVLNSPPSVGKFPDIAEARAECLWLGGHPTESAEALDTIPVAVPLTPKGIALRTLIKLMTGDQHGAENEYEQIRPDQVRSAIEWEWVFLAGLASGDIESVVRWIEYIEKITPADLEALLVALQAAIQIENHGWISASLAQSTTWIDIQGAANASVDSLVNRIEQSALPETTIEAVHQLVDLHMGRLRAENSELPARIAIFNEAFLEQCQCIALIRANRPLKAIQLFDGAPDELYNRSYSALLRGIAHSNADQFTAAEKQFEQASKFSTIKPIARFFEAQMWESAGVREQAITALNDAISLQPNEANWHMQLASLYLEDDQQSAALPHLQQAAELAPEDTQILVALARAYRSNGQLSDAEEMYHRGLQANPASPKIWKEAGQVALASGDNDRAKAWFDRACSLLPGDASCIIGSARTAQRLGNTKEALEQARKAFAISPDDPQILSGLGDILAENGSLDKAIQVYDRAMRISEQSSEIRLARSNLLLKAGRKHESIADLEQLVDQDPDHHEAWVTLADAYTAIGEFEQGLQAAQQAVNISPSNIDYRFLMAKLCRESGQLDQALEILSKLESEAPGRADIACEKGIVYEERRELDLAIDAYNRALAINSHDADTVIRAGLLLKQMKAYEESAALLERGTELIPNDANLHQQLAAVRALQFVHGQRFDEQAAAS
jgi:tetratricopeptide (TPR) repeat protein